MHVIQKFLTLWRRIGDFPPIKFEKLPRAWISSNRRQISAENYKATLNTAKKMSY